ncbi:Lrp/AsnC family transcriptional regulator [Natronolimnohabitans innermongolicus]|uniref:AsnC family transcriptional regulator n=1 Tax=Natronolimnohabitans innermongolicus JCM 12255 TaxID=1227499 RepID=L9XBU0_9EURY|nr:winged helix-turn-helix transcriptional regulator [Natronolimnohabitans innermongolicus]ELY58906.1 AsnC family transcriptional regulator [Natronolimnohabitans innermongolicus JCM 12255]
MAADGLDEIDYGILHLLQQNARSTTPVDMAEQLPVTDTTIRNRIDRLEEEGVIEGYVPIVNYEKAGFPIRLQFSCTAPTKKRHQVAGQALELPHVVKVDEMLSARENVQVLAVAKTTEEVNEITAGLDDLPLTIERESLLREERRRPFGHFGQHVVDD